MKNDHGFTVIELLVIIIILGILAALISGFWFSIGAGRSKAEENAYNYFSALWPGGDFQVSCNRDTDGNGYSSCTAVKAGESKTVECPSGWFVGDTCREPKLGINQYNYHSN